MKKEWQREWLYLSDLLARLGNDRKDEDPMAFGC